MHLKRVAHTMRRSPHLALYGNVAITRVYCETCDGYTLVIRGHKQCCDEVFIDEVTRIKRITNVPFGRRGPSAKYRERQLRAQDNRCFYCHRRFGATVYRRARPLTLKINWDHMIPYDYARNNHDLNFVAACHVCNGLKSSLIFDMVELARLHINARWQEKGYSDTAMCILPREVPTSH